MKTIEKLKNRLIDRIIILQDSEVLHAIPPTQKKVDFVC